MVEYKRRYAPNLPELQPHRRDPLVEAAWKNPAYAIRQIMLGSVLDADCVHMGRGVYEGIRDQLTDPDE